MFTRLNICRIKNSPYEQNEACEIVIDYEHEWSVKGDSRGDKELQGGVTPPPIRWLGLFHLQQNLMRSLSVMTQKQE